MNKSEQNAQPSSVQHRNRGPLPSLLDMSAKIVAARIPFQSIEQRYEHIPEPVQRRIIFWSFPRHEDDIRMYSSLSSEHGISQAPTPSTSGSTSNAPVSGVYPWMDFATGTNQSSSNSPISKTNHNKQWTFYRGMKLFKDNCVNEVLQVGFNLTGIVVVKTNGSQLSVNSKARSSQSIDALNNASHNINLESNSSAGSSNDSRPQSESTTRDYRVSVTFDRCKITSVSCSCDLQDIFWCEHVVALIIYRIRNAETIDLRVPISETLSSLDRQQLQKLVQYIISEHHTEVLPTAQRLLDEMRQSLSEINRIQGAPDPTAGASVDDDNTWHLDEIQVKEKVQNYLNCVGNNAKDAHKQLNALFEKIREMFKAKDSNGTRLLRLITEQFLRFATKNEKSRPLWDQLVSLWVVVMMNPDTTKPHRDRFAQLLTKWSIISSCPKEDVERRMSIKRKTAEQSDDEDSEDFYQGGCYSNYSQSNNNPAHMANHRIRTYQPSNLSAQNYRHCEQTTAPACPCQSSMSGSKRLRTNQSNPTSASSRSFANYSLAGRSPSRNVVDNRIPQEPRSIFHRALDLQDITWDDSDLQAILNKGGPGYSESSRGMYDCRVGGQLWDEPISIAAARIETLKSHGYVGQALKLTVSTVRCLKLQQDRWCIAATSATNSEPPCTAIDMDRYSEPWIGHPLDPISILVDTLLEASTSEAQANRGMSSTNNVLCTTNTTRCCPFDQALADFTHKLLPDLSTLSYHHRLDGFPILPLVNLAPRRPLTTTQQQASSDKSNYHHVPLQGCCSKESYLTLAVETALIALGQQRPIPTISSALDRAVRQEAELISKLETIDTSDPNLLEIVKNQAALLLQGAPFHNSSCGVSTDSAPLHTFAKYLFDTLVGHYPQLAYKVGVYALKMPLLPDDNIENVGAARTSPRPMNFNHLQSEQLALAQAMLSKAKDEVQQGGFLRKVYRASVKNIRNPASLLKLSKHVMKEAKPNGTTLYPALLRTSFDLGLQVLKMTLAPHTSNGKIRREAILFIVECATDIGLDAVLQMMRDSRDYFSAMESLNLVVARDNDHVNVRLQAIAKLRLKENPLREVELNQRSRELVLECAIRDPTNCALEALKFCETDKESLDKALKIVMDAGGSGTMDSSQLIKVADYIHERNMTDRAFEIAMVAIGTLSIPSNSDNSSSKKDIFSACEYAQKVNGFSTLIPKLIENIECATVLSEIYHRYHPSASLLPPYRSYNSDLMSSLRGNINYSKEYNNILNSLNTELYKQTLEDARWWDALLRRTLKAFVDTTRTRLQNISPRHYGEFIDFLVKAHGTFEKANDGPQQFKDLISEIIKSYRTKKKLIERLKGRFDHHIRTNLSSLSH